MTDFPAGYNNATRNALSLLTALANTDTEALRLVEDGMDHTATFEALVVVLGWFAAAQRHHHRAQFGTTTGWLEYLAAAMAEDCT